MWLGLECKNEDYEEVQIHLILIGLTGVGKTSLRKHLKNEPIDMNEAPTIVMEPEFLYRESVESRHGYPFKHIKYMSTAGAGEESIFLTMWDTGGQPIFQDLLPCFARLNCMYGIVFRLTDLEDFDSKPEMRARDEYHESAISPFTKKDIFFRNLEAFSSSMQEKIKDLPMLKTRDPSSSTGSDSPAATVVGTFKDEFDSLSHDDSLCHERSQESKRQLLVDIKEFIHHSDMTIFKNNEMGDSEYILEVDNTASAKTADAGIKHLRRSIHQCAEESKISIRSDWQKFKLTLQRKSYQDAKHVNQGIIPLNEAISIGEECGVRNPKSALMVFHEIGVFMWYHLSKRRSMNNFVVIDQKILLDALSKVFSFNPKITSSSVALTLLMRKGILTFDFFQQLLKSKASNISDEWFIAFLEEHHLIMKIGLSDHMGSRGYFIPSILQTIPNLTAAASGISPLYLIPSSIYIPTGMFTRLLTALAGVTPGITVWKIPLENCALEQVCRNQFEFIVNDRFHIVLSEYSKYIRVDAIPIGNEIMEDLLFHIVITLYTQLQRIVPQWIEKQPFRFTFECTCKNTEQIHFFIGEEILFYSKREIVCSESNKSFLQESQLYWCKDRTTLNKGRQKYFDSLST